MNFALRFLGLICLLFASFGETKNSVSTEYSMATLFSEAVSLSPDQEFRLLLSLKHREKWHSYWLNPGDSGMPTTADWSLPEGFSVISEDFPTPETIAAGPLINFGYDTSVQIIYTLKAPTNLNELNVVKARFDWLVCDDICIPESVDLSLTLTKGDGALQESLADQFQSARQLIPHQKLESAFYIQNGVLNLEIQSQELADGPVYFFPLEPLWIEPSTPQEWNRFTKGISGRIALVDQPPSVIEGVLRVGDRGYLIQGPISGSPESEKKEVLGLGMALLLAFVGGIILNLMPCVLPILFLKAWSLARTQEMTQKAARREGVLYSLGIVLSFLLIAGVLLILKTKGEELGWGFQLQVPGFVFFMAILMFVIGLNLIGWFELPVLMGEKNQELAQSDSPVASFMTGVLATFVATPCSGPFMAAAIGFALSQNAVAALLIFGFLGLGLASPYLLICWFPALRSRLPKPGKWMENLRQLLGFPMFITTAWLLWVLTLQTDDQTLLYSMFYLVFISFCLWWIHKADQRSRVYRFGLTVILLIACVILALAIPGLKDSDAAKKADWQEFSETKIQEYLSQGKPVFVDVTASWCISCMVNERVVLDTESVQEMFLQNEVQLLKADWTKKDAVIARYLQSFGREGVPLYVLYRPDGTKEILPQVLTEGIIRESLDSLK